MTRVMAIRVEHLDYGRATWQCWRDQRLNEWILRTDDGCERVIGETWAVAALYINTIAENYGCILRQKID